MEAYLATAVDEDAENVIEEDDDDDDSEWVAKTSPPRRRRRAVNLKAPRKKREKKDWCSKLMRKLEITCSTSSVHPKHKTRRGE